MKSSSLAVFTLGINIPHDLIKQIGSSDQDTAHCLFKLLISIFGGDNLFILCSIHLNLVQLWTQHFLQCTHSRNTDSHTNIQTLSLSVKYTKHTTHTHALKICTFPYSFITTECKLILILAISLSGVQTFETWSCLEIKSTIHWRACEWWASFTVKFQV